MPLPPKVQSAVAMITHTHSYSFAHMAPGRWRKRFQFRHWRPVVRSVVVVVVLAHDPRWSARAHKLILQIKYSSHWHFISPVCVCVCLITTCARAFAYIHYASQCACIMCSRTHTHTRANTHTHILCRMQAGTQRKIAQIMCVFPCMHMRARTRVWDYNYSIW